MLTVAGLTKGFAGRTLFSEAALQIDRGDRIGLVGPNGAGKSTLFSLLLGEESPDAGTIDFRRNVTVGHLPQENVPVNEETVVELATAITPEIAFLQKRLKAHEAGATDHDDEFHDVQARFDQLGGYRLEARAGKILDGLSFRQSDLNRPARTLSGGWVMRAHLARLLVLEPDLLLLDEPTNHLDLESLLWFQGYLQQYPGAILTISHDREFLNRLVGSIVEIRQTRLIRYRGNYDEFLEQRAANERQLEAAYKNQQREIARLQTFVDRFRAKNTKATQAQSKLRQIERMEKLEAPSSPEATIGFTFPQPKRTVLKDVRLERVRHAYGELQVYNDLNFEAERGQRIVLVGPNGAGKSTLLKLLAGVLPVQEGSRHLGYHVKVGYYSQYRIEMLDPKRTALEEALDTSQPVSEQFVRTVLGSFLFRGDDVFKRVSVLSGGEKSRLALVKLLLDPPNLLLMDEPTTHLDLASVDALLEALRQYQGTLLLISHDVYFIRGLANHVVEVRNGSVRHFPGEYQYYLDKTKSEAAALAGPEETFQRSRSLAKPPDAGNRREQRRREAELRQARSRARRAQQEVVTRLEQRIHALEAKQTELTAALEDPDTYTDSAVAIRINRELKDAHETLGELNAEWEKEATRLHDIEQGGV